MVDAVYTQIHHNYKLSGGVGYTKIHNEVLHEIKSENNDMSDTESLHTSQGAGEEEE